jgi:hypothetical protein
LAAVDWPPPRHYYIPSLRGLRPTAGDSDTYSARTLLDYQLPAENIFTGLDMFVRVRKMLLGDLQARKQIAEYEKFLSYNFFHEQQISLIPREHERNDVLYVKIGQESERPIYSLGDGIQSVIILTFLPYTVGGMFTLKSPRRTFTLVCKGRFSNAILSWRMPAFS